MTDLPPTRLLRLEQAGGVLTAWMDDAPTRNALSVAMRDELIAMTAMLERGSGIRALVLRGANGTFCSGGDLKAFKAATAASPPAAGELDPMERDNRIFGAFLQRFNALPLVTFALVEGAAFAGALGLLCTADVVIVLDDARFAVTETAIGLVPAQIAPFIVQRIGLTQTRRLALTGARFDGVEAERLGIAQFHRAGLDEAEALLAELVAGTLRCAPGATAATKRLLQRAAAGPTDDVLDHAAGLFTAALRGAEGQEGIAAFADKRRPAWLEP